MRKYLAIVIFKSPYFQKVQCGVYFKTDYNDRKVLLFGFMTLKVESEHYCLYLNQKLACKSVLCFTVCR